MSMKEFFEPRISADTKAYWDGCREHKLMVQKCKTCGRLRIPASYVCQNCLSTETELVEMKPEGTLYSFVVMHRAFHPSVQDKVPYIVATIDLSEDVRILANMFDVDPDELKCGAEVTIDFADSETYSRPIAKLKEKK